MDNAFYFITPQSEVLAGKKILLRPWFVSHEPLSDNFEAAMKEIVQNYFNEGLQT